MVKHQVLMNLSGIFLQVYLDELQADDRRLAELHYKMSLTLQYLDQPEDALKEIKVKPCWSPCLPFA